jgi:hypothetical protein
LFEGLVKDSTLEFVKESKCDDLKELLEPNKE